MKIILRAVELENLFKDESFCLFSFVLVAKNSEWDCSIHLACDVFTLCRKSQSLYYYPAKNYFAFEVTSDTMKTAGDGKLVNG